MLKNKLFKEFLGSIVKGSIKYFAVREGKQVLYGLSFKSGQNLVKTHDKRFITKFGQLFGFSYTKLLKDIEEGDATVKETEGFIQDTTDYKKEVVLLYDKKNCVNIVSKKHKQLSMDEIHTMISRMVSKIPDAKPLGLTETEGGYINSYEIGTNPQMRMQVNINYGRNDAKGRASIRFTGGGHIFVCSNMIIPYVHKELRISKNMQLARPKIIHTLQVTEKTRKNVIVMFNEAKDAALMLAEKLRESEEIVVNRTLQDYCIKLIDAKHQIGEKYVKQIIERLREEKETLYGLSQAITWVGTRAEKQYIKDKLCSIGGQVILLGKEFPKLLENNLKTHEITVKQ